MQDLLAAIPELEGMMAGYNEWKRREIVPLESQFEEMQTNCGKMPEGRDKDTVRDQMEALRDKIDAMKKEKSAPIEDLIRKKYNADLVKQELGIDDSALTKDNVLTKLPTIKAFRGSPKYEYYMAMARDLFLSGSAARVDLLGGAASRLFGEGQNVDPALSYTLHDVYDVADARRYNYPKEMIEKMIRGLLMFDRIIIREWIKMEEEIARKHPDFRSAQIAEERRQILKMTPRIVVINNESGPAIVKHFVDNDFYGHDPSLVVFTLQNAFKGYDAKNSKPVLDETSRPLAVGHGDSTMQIPQQCRSFTVDRNGKVTPLKESADDYISRKTDNRVKVCIESRVNDMFRLGYSADTTESGLRVYSANDLGNMDMEVFALALSEMGDLDDIHSGKNAILEQVAPDPNIKGSSPMQAQGKAFSIESLAHSDHVKQLLKDVAGPFNRFYIFYKMGAFKLLKDSGLPAYIRFRDGLLYPEIVTGDLTMLNGMNAGYVESDRVLTDYKDGKKTLPLGVNAARYQDTDSEFLTHLEELQGTSRGRDVALSGLEAAPGFAKNAVGAIRLKGGGYSATEHGARTYGMPEGSSVPKPGKDTINGVIKAKIKEGAAYSPFGYTHVFPDDIYIRTVNSIDGVDQTMLKELKNGVASNVVIVKGLKAALPANLAADFALTYGVSRESIYMDEEDFKYLLSLPDGVAIMEEAINHEKTHIENPDLSEADVEKRATSYNVRMAFALRDVQDKRAAMNITQRTFVEGQAYDGIGIYYKPLAKFAKFGTSGVRWLVKGAAALLAELPERIAYYISNDYKRTTEAGAVLAEDFNMPNVGVVIKSIALYNLKKAQGIYPVISGSAEEFKKKLFEKGLLVAYDNRPGNPAYAEETAKILAAYGIKVVLNELNTPTPLPAVSRLVQEGGYAGSITFTASHNGDEWNGIKFEGEDGGAASPMITDAIGAILAEELALSDSEMPIVYDIAENDLEGLIREGKVKIVDMLDFYVNAVSGYLNKDAIISAITGGRVEFIYSAFFGSSGPVMVPTKNIIETVRPEGVKYVQSYEPTLEKLTKLMETVRAKGGQISASGRTTVVVGGSADNDADRFQVNEYNRTTGEVDEFTPEKLAAVFGHYLMKHKGLKGPMGRSFVSGTLQDQVAKFFEQDVIETATGFKFSPKVFNRGGVLFAEESYGLSFKDWTLDKDGIMPSLLALELVAVTGKSLNEYYSDMLAELKGAGLKTNISFKRYDQTLDKGAKQNAINKFAGFFDSIKTGEENEDGVAKVIGDIRFGGQRIVSWYNPKKFDGGRKFVLENGSWVAFRSSGTEPIIRLYVEAGSEEEREALKRELFRLIEISDKNKDHGQDELSADEKALLGTVAPLADAAIASLQLTTKLSPEMRDSILNQAAGLLLTVNKVAAPETPRKVILLGYDTALDPDSTALAQAGEKLVKKYLGDTFIVVRASGADLAKLMQQQAALLGDRQKVVMTISGDETLDQIKGIPADRAALGRVLNISGVMSAEGKRPIPVFGLYDLVIRIAYEQDVEQYILPCLKRIAQKGEGVPFTKDDIDELLNNMNGILRIIPRAAPVDMSEAAEINRASRSVAQAL
jgi:phosphoglucomutase